jgi:anti-sigma factor RsiW
MGLFRKRHGAPEHSHMEALSAYLDGQLSPAKRQALESHLGTCEQCQWNLQTLRTTVQWTRDLPVVPLPRAFTIPVPATPAREPRWRWSLPVLQGATAVVALLFVFSVAGDLILSRVLPASAPLVPRGEVALQEAPAADEAAEAPLQVEEALPPEPTVLAESAVSDETPSPLIEAAPATDGIPEGEAQKAMATEALEARALGATGIEAPVEEAEVAVTLEKEASSDMVAGEPPPMAAAEAVGQATAPAEPTPMPVPATLPPTAEPAPTAVPTTQPPTAESTVIASYHAPVQPAAEDEVRRTEGAYRPSLVGWLGVVEVVFGVTFVLLAMLTIALTFRRLRTR